MRILVTGGSGFIGTNAIDAFMVDHHVLNIDIASPRNPMQKSLWRQVDICNEEALRGVFSSFRPEGVLHLAARTDLDGVSVAEYGANTAGVENLIRAASVCETVQSVVFASSRLVCRIGYEPKDDEDYCPTTAYGESKAAGEKIVKKMCADARYQWTIVRPTSIWGPWFGVPYKNFFDAVRSGAFLMPTRTTVLKSFGYVGNAAYALRRLLLDKGRGNAKTLYLADYEPIELGQMAAEIGQHYGKNTRLVPLGLLKSIAYAGDAFKLIGVRSPPLTSFRLNNMLTPMVHNLRPLEAIVGPVPYTRDEGIRATVEWMTKHG